MFAKVLDKYELAIKKTLYTFHILFKKIKFIILYWIVHLKCEPVVNLFNKYDFLSLLL